MSKRTDLITHYRWLRQYGLNDSHSGNASVREDDTVWVTPTGACADTLTETELIACTHLAEPGPGASLDAPLHLAVYRENPNTGCVLHAHGPYTLALTMDGQDFHPIDFEGRYYFDVIPVLDMDFSDYLADSPRLVAQTLAKHRICVVRGHGSYAQAPTINQAYKWTCTLEHIAKITYLTRRLGHGG